MNSIRNLHVLDINDRPVDEFRSGVGEARYFKVTRIPTWKILQRALAKDEEISPDLILTDVSFDRDTSVQLAVIPGSTDVDAAIQQAIVPVGPTLALCFLRSRPTVSFAFYSAHMTAPELLSYPPFLVAMGLLAAKAEGRVFLSRHLSNISEAGNLDSYIEGLATFQSRIACLEVALQGYRKSITAKLKAGHLRILNSVTLDNWLAPKKEEVERSPDAVTRIEIPEDLHLWIWGSGGIQDRISVSSLFADQMQWSNSYIDKPGIALFLEWFGGVCDSDPCWTYAIQIMTIQRADSKRLDVVIKEQYADLPNDTLYEVFRLCVLFANIQAWSDERGEASKRKAVYSYLGLNQNQQHTYEEWFAERPEQKGAISGRRKKSSSTVSRLGVPPIPVFNPTFEEGDIGRCFVQRGTALSEDDDRRVEEYRRFFNLQPWLPALGKPYAVAKKETSGA
jgi:hypothetical protein